MKDLEKLKNQNNWVCVKEEATEDKEPAFKIYLDACGCLLSSGDEHKDRRMTFSAADKAKAELSASGVAFVLPTDYAVVVIRKATTDPVVCGVLKHLDTYAENFIKNKAIRVICRVNPSELPLDTDKTSGARKLSSQYYSKNAKNNIEIYLGVTAKRFISYTGKAINDKDICDCTQGLISFLNEFMAKEKKPKKK